jgi:glycosyltransferase involved in cell wall biosynthesis
LVQTLIVGIFHPVLNACGGAEWVSVNIINSLRREDHSTIILTNEKLNQEKIFKMFGCRADVSTEVVFPLELFAETDFHNVYTDVIRMLVLKSKCDVLVDTQSNVILPGADISYIHFPLSARLNNLGKVRAAYYFPYRLYERRQAKSHKKLVFSNSKYTAVAIRNTTGMDPNVLYPPIAEDFFAHEDDLSRKEDTVVSVSRMSPEKQLSIIPKVAKLTNKKIRFIIIGIRQSSHVLNHLLQSIEENKVSERVEVMLDVPRQKLQSILRTSKVYFHPTYGEHFGVSIVEAMASGCIPIVHNSGGPTEFVPKAFRFDGLKEAAEKIESAVFRWPYQQSKEIIQIAQSFSRKNFSANFLKAFDLYTHDLTKRSERQSSDTGRTFWCVNS